LAEVTVMNDRILVKVLEAEAAPPQAVKSPTNPPASGKENFLNRTDPGPAVTPTDTKPVSSFRAQLVFPEPLGSPSPPGRIFDDSAFLFHLSGQTF
jgi:hypothetical protein